MIRAPVPFNIGQLPDGDVDFRRVLELGLPDAASHVGLLELWESTPEVFNVRKYGAVGDGVTDDTVAIEAAIAEAIVSPFGIVFFPPGTYLTTTRITIGSNMSLVGVGAASVIKTDILVKTDVNNHISSIDMFFGDSVTGIEISNLYFDGADKNAADATDEGGAAIFIDSTAGRSSNINIHDCHYTGFDTSIFFANTDRISVRGNIFEANAGASVRALGIADSVITGNICDGSRTAENGANAVNHIWLSQSGGTVSNNVSVTGNSATNNSFEAYLCFGKHCTVTGNSANGCLNGVSLQSASGESSQPVDGGTFCTVTGNVIKGATGASIRIGNSSGNNTVSSHHSLVANNVLDGGTLGIELALDASDNHVHGNTITNTSSHGIALGVTGDRNFVHHNYLDDADDHGILIQGGTGNVVKDNHVNNATSDGIRQNGSTCKHTTITGNVCVDSDEADTSSFNGITITDGDDTFVHGNKCYSSDGTTKQLRGIAIGASAGTAVVTGNDVRGNVNGVGVIDSGVGSRVHANTFDTNAPTVVAAAALTLPLPYEFVEVTGNTNITSMTAIHSGAIVTLKFTGTPTFTDGSNLKLAGNLVATADDTITLACDGTNWFEMSRSIN